MMPVMDGGAFRDEQLKISRLASTPVVVMSADSQAEEKCTSMRADAVLKKPADIEIILKQVEQHERKGFAFGKSSLPVNFKSKMKQAVSNGRD